MNFKTTVFVDGIVGLSLLSAIGCSQLPARIQAPGISPSAAGRQAMAEYDTDGNGVVSGAELDKAPSLKAALATLDANADGGVSADEVTARVKSWQQSGVGLTTARCLVQMNGKPVEGATVVFEPEAFLGSEMPTAQGTTNKMGAALISVPKDKRPTPETPPGLPFGLYKVRISKQANGAETIVAKYNTETTLGQQVASDDPAFANKKVVFEIGGR